MGEIGQFLLLSLVCRFVILYDIAFASIFRTSLLIASGEEASYIKTFIEEYEVSDVTTHTPTQSSRYVQDNTKCSVTDTTR